jgi:hypothetical protein
MRNVVSALCLTAAVAFIAACSGSMPGQSTPSIPGNGVQSHNVIGPASLSPTTAATPLPPLPTGPRPAGWISKTVKSDGSGPLLYVSEEYASEILIYPENGMFSCPIGMITNGVSTPYGLYVDKNENLYVANQNGTVTMYPSGSVSPTVTYSQDLGRPLYAIVDHNGDLFVGNGNGGTDGGNIVEYLAGSTTAHEVLQTPGTEVDGMDFDQLGNLYAAYRGGSGDGSVEEFAPGSTSGQVLGMTLDQPQGLVVDSGGNIVVAQTGGPDNLVVFTPGTTSPKVTLKLPGSSVPTQIALRSDQTILYVTSFPNGYVYRLPYPVKKWSTWKLWDQTPSPDNQGIALSDGQTF